MKTNGSQKIKVIDFVPIAGVRRQNIYKAGSKGTITIKDGLIDLSDPKTIDYVQAQQIKKKLIEEAGAAKLEVKEEAVKFLPEKVKDILASNNGTSKKRKLEEAKIEKQNREIDLRYAKERNELLSRESVGQVFQKLYSIQVAKLHGFSHTVTPDLAVVFESTDNKKMIQCTELINNAMFEVLEEIKKTLNDYLESVEGEEIK